MNDGPAAAAPVLAGIRGWLLVFCITLVPHIIGSALLLAAYWRSGLAPGVGPAGLEVLQLAVTLVGHSVGLGLILARSRYAPAYFVAYLSLLVVLLLADPNPTATYVQRLRVMGVSQGATRDHAQAVRGMVVSLVATAVAFGYWMRSARVRSVFGSTGLQILRRPSAGGPED